MKAEQGSQGQQCQQALVVRRLSRDAGISAKSECKNSNIANCVWYTVYLNLR